MDLSQEKKGDNFDDVWIREGYYLGLASQQSSGSSQHPSQSTEIQNKVRHFLNTYRSPEATLSRRLRKPYDVAQSQVALSTVDIDQLISDLKSKVTKEICPRIIGELNAKLGANLEHNWQIKIEIPRRSWSVENEKFIVIVNGKSKTDSPKLRDEIRGQSQTANSVKESKRQRKSTPRVRKSAQQVNELESIFEKNWYPNVEQRTRLVKSTGLSDNTIRLWFQSRRNLERKQGRQTA